MAEENGWCVCGEVFLQHFGDGGGCVFGGGELSRSRETHADGGDIEDENGSVGGSDG